MTVKVISLGILKADKEGFTIMPGTGLEGFRNPQEVTLIAAGGREPLGLGNQWQPQQQCEDQTNGEAITTQCRILLKSMEIASHAASVRAGVNHELVR